MAVTPCPLLREETQTPWHPLSPSPKQHNPKAMTPTRRGHSYHGTNIRHEGPQPHGGDSHVLSPEGTQPHGNDIPHEATLSHGSDPMSSPIRVHSPMAVTLLSPTMRGGAHQE